jgi:hypothetical protein
MAKQKKFDAPDAPQQEQQVLGTTEPTAEQIPAEPPKPALPSFHLLREPDGVQFKLIRYALPKRHEKNPEGDLKIIIDGVPTPAWKTDSKGWSVEGTELIYVYLKLANDVTVYLVLQGEDVADQYFSLKDGEGTRPNPKSTSKLSEEEKALRLATAKATREANKAAAPVATPDAPDTAATVEQVHP